MQRLVNDGTNEGPVRVESPGIAHVLVEAYGSAPLVLMAGASESGPFVNTDVTFSDVGVKRFGTARGFWYTLMPQDTSADTLADVTAWLAQESFGG